MESSETYSKEIHLGDLDLISRTQYYKEKLTCIINQILDCHCRAP